MTAIEIMQLVANQYGDKPDDFRLHIGHHQLPSPAAPLGFFNLPECAAYLALTLGEVREMAGAQPQMNRNDRQAAVISWVHAAFGADSVAQRALRFLEESIEAYQAAGCDAAVAHCLIDYVFDKPAGVLNQELGGVGVTLLALAATAGLSADEEEQREFARVLSKPLAHFSARNQAKNAAGFIATGEGN